MEKAKTHNPPILHKYVALYAAKLLKDGFVKEALNLYSSYGAPAMPQNFNIYNHIATEMFALSDLSGTDSYNDWEKLRQMLFEIVSIETWDRVTQIRLKNVAISHPSKLSRNITEIGKIE